MLTHMDDRMKRTSQESQTGSGGVEISRARQGISTRDSRAQEGRKPLANAQQNEPKMPKRWHHASCPHTVHLSLALVQVPVPRILWTEYEGVTTTFLASSKAGT